MREILKRKPILPGWHLGNFNWIPEREILLSVLMFLLVTVTIYYFITRNSIIVWDFQPVWEGSKALFLEGISPYADAVTIRLEMESYGRLAKPGEDPRAFTYPLYALFFTAPLVKLPRSWAQAFWLSLLLMALLIGVFLSISTGGYRPRKGLTLLLCLWVLVFYPVTWALVLGQLSVLVFTFMTTAVWAISHRRGVLSGAAIALTTVKPNLAFLLVLAFLLWSARRRHWSVLFSFFAITFGFLASSLMLYPKWPGEFYQALQRYAASRPFISPVQLLTGTVFGELAMPITLAVSLMLTGGIAFIWWREGKSEVPSHKAVALTLAVTFLLAPRSHLADQVILLLPLLWFVLDPTRSPRGRVWVILVVICFTIFFWALYFAIIVKLPQPQGEILQHNLLAPILPMLILTTGVVT